MFIASCAVAFVAGCLATSKFFPVSQSLYFPLWLPHSSHVGYGELLAMEMHSDSGIQDLSEESPECIVSRRILSCFSKALCIFVALTLQTCLSGGEFYLSFFSFFFAEGSTLSCIFHSSLGGRRCLYRLSFSLVVIYKFSKCIRNMYEWFEVVVVVLRIVVMFLGLLNERCSRTGASGTGRFSSRTC